jgi:hypothetical protein
MIDKAVPPDKNSQIRCPKLGHQIYFTYCYQENFGKPCAKILDCWHCYFDVVSYLQEQMSPAEWKEAFVKPVQPKMASLVELITEAQKIKKQKG